MPFIPHTSEDVDAMLTQIGAADTEALFAEIPESLRCEARADIGPGLTEMQMLSKFSRRARSDEVDLCFIGAGAYDHHIPAAVWDLAGRGEFLTAYTPYQAEASQGTLQVIYEFQTMMASLTGLDVSNASVYDGGSGLAEAILMAVRANRGVRSRTVVVAGAVNPFYVQAARTITRSQGVTIVTCSDAQGAADLVNCEIDDPVAVVVQQPNFYGGVDDVDAAVDWAHARGALAVGVVNPLTLAVLKAPGQWGERGADIACGDGQPLGIPMSSGGPSFGFICTKQTYVRQMPGRIIGRTDDIEGRQGFVLTLQAREQHIRRGKATSNICTNQGLLVTAATIYMSLLGPTGLRRTALASHARTLQLVDALTTIPGVVRRNDGPCFNECVIDLGVDAEPIVERLAQVGILAGFPLGAIDAALAPCLLVCATEKRTDEEIDRYRVALDAALADEP